MGIYSITGFTECFSAQFPCRICKENKKNIRERSLETDSKLLRNLLIYEADVKTNNLTLTGIKSRIIFNILKSYHIVQNASLDLMHDFFVGIGRYDMCILFNYLLNSDKIGLNGLNPRIIHFDYGVDAKDKPPALSEIQLKQGSITLYASQMSTLVKYLPLAI